MNLRALIAALLVLATPAAAQTQAPTAVAVEAPWARATIGNNRITAAYMTLRNGAGQADRLVAVSTPIGRAEIHAMTMDNDVMRMRQVTAIDIPAGGTATLQPGGVHIMLVDLRAPLRAGAQVPLVLRFDRAGTLEVSVPVLPVNATRAPAHGH
jgi:hypothetical protein